MAKSKESVNRTRDAYKADLQDLNRYNPQVGYNPRAASQARVGSNPKTLGLRCNNLPLNSIPQYVENMTEVFERCQMSEAQRLQKFKETLFSLQKVLNVAEYEE